MCGRYTLDTQRYDIAGRFLLDLSEPIEEHIEREQHSSWTLGG